MDEFKPFVFEVVCRGSGNHQQGKSIVAIDSNGHLFAERWAVPLVDFPDHLI